MVTGLLLSDINKNDNNIQNIIIYYPESNLIPTKAYEVGHSSLWVYLSSENLRPQKVNEWNLEHLSPSLVTFPLCPTLDHEIHYKSDSYIVWGLEIVSMG